LCSEPKCILLKEFFTRNCLPFWLIVKVHDWEKSANLITHIKVLYCNIMKIVVFRPFQKQISKEHRILLNRKRVNKGMKITNANSLSYIDKGGNSLFKYFERNSNICSNLKFCCFHETKQTQHAKPYCYFCNRCLFSLLYCNCFPRGRGGVLSVGGKRVIGSCGDSRLSSMLKREKGQFILVCNSWSTMTSWKSEFCVIKHPCRVFVLCKDSHCYNFLLK